LLRQCTVRLRIFTSFMKEFEPSSERSRKIMRILVNDDSPDDSFDIAVFLYEKDTKVQLTFQEILAVTRL
jgi:hypothetical protein